MRLGIFCEEKRRIRADFLRKSEVLPRIGLSADQGPFVLHGKAARRVVNLHGRNTEVGQNNVSAVNPSLPQDFWQTGEIRAMRGENFRAKPKRS